MVVACACGLGLLYDVPPYLQNSRKRNHTSSTYLDFPCGSDKCSLQSIESFCATAGARAFDPDHTSNVSIRLPLPTYLTPPRKSFLPAYIHNHLAYLRAASPFRLYFRHPIARPASFYSKHITTLLHVFPFVLWRFRQAQAQCSLAQQNLEVLHRGSAATIIARCFG